MIFVDVAVFGFATWRLSSLLVAERGPWDILERLRHTAGVRYDENGERYAHGVLGRLLICIWCASFWVGLAVVIAAFLAPRPTFWACMPFALSAVAILIDGVIEQHGHRPH